MLTEKHHVLNMTPAVAEGPIQLLQHWKWLPHPVSRIRRIRKEMTRSISSQASRTDLMRCREVQGPGGSPILIGIDGRAGSVGPNCIRSYQPCVPAEMCVFQTASTVPEATRSLGQINHFIREATS